MSRFKIPLILFGSVFFVSFILAFISGSSYFSSVKALLSAVTATAFFFVAKFLLGKYIPDLFETKDDVADSSSLGSNVDIRIQGDESVIGANTLSGLNNDTPEKKGISPYADIAHSTSLDDGLSSLEGLSLEEPSFDDDKKDTNKKGDFGSSASLSATTIEKEQANNDMVEKKTPFSSSSLSSENSEKSNVGISSNDLEPSNVSSSENAEGESRISDTDSTAGAGLTQAIKQDVDRLEELPDLQEFVDTSHGGEQSRGDELMSAGTQSFFETDLAENVTDTNLMTSAIRTMLRRES